MSYRLNEAMWDSVDMGNAYNLCIRDREGKVIERHNITNVQPINEGCMGSVRVWISDHESFCFKNYQNRDYMDAEVAAYHVALELGIRMPYVGYASLEVDDGYDNHSFKGTVCEWYDLPNGADYGIYPNYSEPSYARMKVFDALLSKGDDHEWNYLVDRKTREYIPIDYGFAFGSLGYLMDEIQDQVDKGNDIVIRELIRVKDKIQDVIAILESFPGHIEEYAEELNQFWFRYIHYREELS